MKLPIMTAISAALLLAAWLPSGCQGDAATTEGLLPRSDEIEGWARDGEMLRYGPDALWEYIDGAAENFLSYDFQEVVVQDYTSGDRRLKVEIYRLGSPLMAFGIYSQFRGPGLHYLRVGAEGFSDPYSLYFWKDVYLVKVAVFEQTDELSTAMGRFAAAIAEKIPGEALVPDEVHLFPEEGLVEHSITYITEGVLGSADFPPAFVADYRYGEAAGKLYLSVLGSEEKARELFRLNAAVIGAEGSAADTSRGSFDTAKGTDRYRGEMVLFRHGSWLGVLTGFDGAEEERDQLVGLAVEKIGGREKAPEK